MTAFDVALRELVRDLVKTEVLPAIREEVRVATRAVGAPTASLEFLTVAEAAAVAKVDDDTVRGWIKSRVLPARRLPDQRQFRIRRTDLDALLAPDGEAGAAAPDPAEEAARVMSLAQARMAKKGER